MDTLKKHSNEIALLNYQSDIGWTPLTEKVNSIIKHIDENKIKCSFEPTVLLKFPEIFRGKSKEEYPMYYAIAKEFVLYTLYKRVLAAS